MNRRVALYGGTFDPVHVGHLTVARTLNELFRFDEVLFVPAHIAPHKRRHRVTAAWHRYAMLALATQDEPTFRLSTIELDAPERPYTIETVARLQAELGTRTQTFFIMGADSWLEIETWREWRRLLELTNTVVATRPGYTLDAKCVDAEVTICDLRGMSESAIRDVLNEEILTNEPQIYFTDAVMVDVSATMVRREVETMQQQSGRQSSEADGNNVAPPEQSIMQLLTRPVAEYIIKHKLYTEEQIDGFRGTEHTHTLRN